MGELVTKTELARRLGVTPARISQLLAAGQISDNAIVGTGRHALIDEAIARSQLDERLDRVQREAQSLPFNATVATPLDHGTAADLGRAISRAADGALAFIANRLASKLGVPPNTTLRELRQAWVDYCEKPK